MSLAKVYITQHPDSPFQVVYTDPTRRERSGRAKRVVKWFAQREAADAHQKSVNKRLQVVGSTGMVFDHQLRADALAARQRLDAAGIRVSLADLAADFVRRHPNERARSLDVFEALKLFLEEKEHAENCAAETIEDLEVRLNRWFKSEGFAVCADITREAAKRLRSRKGSSRNKNNDLSAAHGFCRFLCEQDPPVLEGNPVSGIARPKVEKGRPVSWAPSEAERFMRACEAYRGGKLASAVVVRVFAGVRPSEMVQSRVLLGDAPCVKVEGGKLRGRANRIVPLRPNAVAWLKQYPAGKDGKLPAISKRAWQALRKRADKLDPENPIAWVADIARHSFISYRVAVVQDENKVARESGNSPDEIFGSYFGLKMPEEARVFWGLLPAGVGGKVAG
jgi:integrase